MAVVRGGSCLAIALAVSVAAPATPGATLRIIPVTKLERLSGDAPQPPPLQPVTRLASPLELDGTRMVSLTFPQALPIRDVLGLLVRDTPFSTVVEASVEGSFGGELRNLTLRQALEAVLFPSGLDYEVRRTVIRVFPRRPKTRLFQLDLLAVRRSWQSSPPSPGAIQSSFDSDIFSEIDRGVAALLSAAGRHHVDRRAGLVHVTDFAERLEQVGVYLEAVQLRATRQIRVDVGIFRFTPAAAAAGPRAPVVGSSPGELIAALERAGPVEPVAARTLVTLNNEPASATLSGSSLASVTVTPQASADGFVQLNIVPRLLTDGASRVADGTDTLVRVRDGHTAMLGGFRIEPSGPGEWVIFVTPRIMDEPASSWVRPERNPAPEPSESLQCPTSPRAHGYDEAHEETKNTKKTLKSSSSSTTFVLRRAQDTPEPRRGVGLVVVSSGRVP